MGSFLDPAQGSAARLRAFNLEARSALVDASSGASAEVKARNELNADASSGAEIRYQGNPRLERDVNSGGSVEKD